MAERTIENFEFTTTATNRPEVLDETYNSFSKNIIDVDFSKSVLYINIDPAPEGERKGVADVAKKYFGQVIVNLPDVSNFSNAVKWCWTQPCGEFFFHLEDDWVLRSKVHMKELQNKLLCMMENSKRYRIKSRMLDRYIAVNLRAYDFINDHRVCLSPGLFLTSWAKKAANILDPQHNPERQMRRGFGVGKEYLIESKALHHPHNKNNIIISDIGRSWLNKTGHKKKNGMAFVFWEKS